MESLFKKAGGTFIIKIIGLGAAFIFQIILSRMLKPELYGQYTMFLTYINVVSIIAVLGMDSNLIKEVAKDGSSCRKECKLLMFSLKTSILLYALLAIIISIFHRQLSISSNMLGIFLGIFLFKIISLILDGFLQGMGKVIKVTFLNVLLNNVLKIILFILFVKFHIDGLYAAMYASALGELIALGIRSTYISKIFSNSFSMEGELSRNEKNKFLKYSITVSLIAGIGLLLQNVDKIMISNALGFENVAIYKVSQNYISLIAIFISPFIAFLPVISRLYEQNKIKEIEKQMKSIVKVVTALVIPMFFLFLFLSDKLLGIFGKGYATMESKKVLLILALAFLIDAVSGPIASILTMTRYAKYILINNIVALFINIFLNIIFIKKYGIVGAAVATGISIVVINLIAIIEVKKLLNIFSYDVKNIIQIFLSVIGNYYVGILLVSVLKIKNNYIYIIVFGIIVYFINVLFIVSFNRKFVFEKLRWQKKKE